MPYKNVLALSSRDNPYIVFPAGLVIQVIGKRTKQNPSDNDVMFLWVVNEATSRVLCFQLNTLKITTPTGILVPPVVQNTPSYPRGIVLNNTDGFKIETKVVRDKSILIVCTRDGQILGWNGLVKQETFISKYIATDGASYTGLAMFDNYLYACDFVNGKIDTFNSDFTLQNKVVFPFSDLSLISSPYKPYNIAKIDIYLYVTYAINIGGSRNRPTNVKGQGYGFINVFTSTGVLVRRLVNKGGNLDSPWGISDFSCNFYNKSYVKKCVNDGVLVANNGNGKLEVVNKNTGIESPYLKDCSCEDLVIPGLTGIVNINDKVIYSAGGDRGNIGYLGFLTHSDNCKQKVSVQTLADALQGTLGTITPIPPLNSRHTPPFPQRR
jgi:uncharacterized protein (TIGR03118 family)